MLSTSPSVDRGWVSFGDVSRLIGRGGGGLERQEGIAIGEHFK